MLKEKLKAYIDANVPIIYVNTYDAVSYTHLTLPTT